MADANRNKPKKLKEEKMAGNVLWGFIFGNVIASIFNVLMIGRDVKGWHLTAFWVCVVAVCIGFMLQAPPVWRT